MPDIEVSLSHQRGLRPYQEDRFLMGSEVDVSPAKARRFLSRLFGAAAHRTRNFEAGSTATAVLVSRSLHVSAAFVGDSPLLLFTYDPATGAASVEKLTRDHHAALPEEKRRIERRGGHVAPNGRADGRLALSRAFGDAGIAGIAPDAEFIKLSLAPTLAEGKEVYLCLASDGLLEGIAPEDYLGVFKVALGAGRGDALADIFTTHALQSGSQDNVTAFVAKIPAAPDKNLFLAIADGHGGDKTSEEVVKTFRAEITRKPSL